MFVTPAYAQTASGGGDIFGAIFPLLLMIPVFYFLLIRPQQKQRKAHQEKLAGVRRGDQVVTGGGIIGKVTKVVEDANEIEIEVSDGTKMRVMTSLLADVRSKTDPVKEK